MKQRCQDVNAINYRYYGGKGVSVCEEWRDNLQAFYEWSISNGYAEHLTLDRIDNDKGYSPDNCRWVTMKEQQNNRSNNVKKDMEDMKNGTNG